MEIMSILLPIIVLGVMAVVFGAVLGFAGIKFRVEQDDRIPMVRECLPGADQSTEIPCLIAYHLAIEEKRMFYNVFD